MATLSIGRLNAPVQRRSDAERGVQFSPEPGREMLSAARANWGLQRWRRFIGTASLLLVLSPQAVGASLAPGAQQRLAAATFEVVLAKPEVDHLTYEKPLPLDLLPFRERNDKYQSIGTAFAVGPNRFATAGHVLAAGAGSQYGPPAVRDAAGNVYLIDTVLSFSGAEDCAIFSVQNPPSVVPLTTRTRPELNQPVFAVGNAYGEGVVIRDGLYTSDTPEEMDGRWKWLRYSAAASPGNSGGPLVDRNGKVIGVILRNSPNENLNYAVAIDQVLAGSEEWGVLEARSSYRMLVMKASDAIIFKGKVALPKPVAEFYAELQTAAFESYTRAYRKYLEHHGANIFPHGAASVQMLNSISNEPFPRLIAETDGGVWSLSKEDPQRAQLEQNGYIDIGAGTYFKFARLKTPEGVNPAGITSDSKIFMDLVLKGFPLRRQVGADAVRVTSLGRAQQEVLYTDQYGRVWQLSNWAVPFGDLALIVMALPTPNGCIMMFATVPTSFSPVMREELKWLTGFVYVTYEGTLKQWQDFQARAAVLPAAVRGVQLQAEYGRGIGIKSSRFQVLVPAGIQQIQPDSVLKLLFSFFADGDSTVWDVAAVHLAENPQATQWIEVQRHSPPPASLPDDFANRWHNLTTATQPWDTIVYNVNGRSQIAGVANLQEVSSGKQSNAYAIVVSADGPRTPAAMKSKFTTLQHGLTILEH